jgi:hypothetical protein
LLAGASGNGGAHFFGISTLVRVMAAPVSQEKKPAGTKPASRRRGSRKQRISKLLSDIEERLDLKTDKVTLTDFIRLTQLERELEEEEQPREIIVTWKEPAEKRCESK